MAAIQTSLNAVENSISKFENLIEDCKMVEEEAHQDQSGSGEEAADIKMVDQEERGNPESSGPHMEANTEDNPLSASGGDTVSPEEEEILWVEHPNLRITAPGVRPPQSQEGWQRYISHPQPTLGLRRGRPHNRYLLFSNKP